MRGDGLAQLGKSLGGTIMRPAFVERLFSRGNDVRGRWKIGLPDLQVNHVLALRLQGTGTHQNVESRFDADAGHSFCELHGSRTPLIASLAPRMVGAVGADFRAAPARPAQRGPSISLLNGKTL